MQPGTGANKKARNWKDIQLIVSSISVALTLGLWSVWASRDKGTAGVQGSARLGLDPTMLASEPSLLPGHVLYLITPTAQTTAPVSEQQQPKRRNRDRDRGGGGGGGGNASTGSS